MLGRSRKHKLGAADEVFGRYRIFMNRNQLIVLWIGVAALVGALLYPPLNWWFPLTVIVLVIGILIVFFRDRFLN